MTEETSPTILVVDDDEDMVELMVELLSTMGEYRVISTQYGKEAVKIIERELPDVVLLDIMMEDMDGTEVCRAVKANEKTAHVQIIALTAIHKNAKKKYQEIMDSGVDGYVEKPFSIEELAIIIERHLKAAA